MSFDWCGFLELASALAAWPSEAKDAEQDQHEAALRSAASRAYYAAFHHAKGYLLAKDPLLKISDHGSSHEEVPTYLKEYGRTRIEKSAASKLESLKRLRKWADYQRSARSGLEADIQQALKDAKSVLTNLVAP